MKLERWFAEPLRDPQVRRPCVCGCDERDGVKGVGYFTASNIDGFGVTLWLENEVDYAALSLALERG